CSIPRPHLTILTFPSRSPAATPVAAPPRATYPVLGSLLVGYAPAPGLHSFPTRRSSDLGMGRGRLCGYAVARGTPAYPPDGHLPRRVACSVTDRTGDRFERGTHRPGLHRHRPGRPVGVHRTAPGLPGRLPQIRRDPTDLPGNGPSPVPGSRGRRLRRARALAQGQPVGL